MFNNTIYRKNQSNYRKVMDIEGILKKSSHSQSVGTLLVVSVGTLLTGIKFGNIPIIV